MFNSTAKQQVKTALLTLGSLMIGAQIPALAQSCGGTTGLPVGSGISPVTQTNLNYSNSVPSLPGGSGFNPIPQVNLNYGYTAPSPVPYYGFDLNPSLVPPADDLFVRRDPLTGPEKLAKKRKLQENKRLKEVEDEIIDALDIVAGSENGNKPSQTSGEQENAGKKPSLVSQPEAVVKGTGSDGTIELTGDSPDNIDGDLTGAGRKRLKRLEDLFGSGKKRFGGRRNRMMESSLDRAEILIELNRHARLLRDAGLR